MGECLIRVAKIKALISFAVTAKLICAFVPAYTECWFSHAAAHISISGGGGGGGHSIFGLGSAGSVGLTEATEQLPP